VGRTGLRFRPRRGQNLENTKKLDKNRSLKDPKLPKSHPDPDSGGLISTKIDPWGRKSTSQTPNSILIKNRSRRSKIDLRGSKSTTFYPENAQKHGQTGLRYHPTRVKNRPRRVKIDSRRSKIEISWKSQKPWNFKKPQKSPKLTFDSKTLLRNLRFRGKSRPDFPENPKNTKNRKITTLYQSKS